MAMDPQQIEKFIEEVKLRAYDDAYIDGQEEKEILQAAVQNGMKIESAQALLKQACARYEFATEAAVRNVLEILLEQFCENDGKIDVDEYNDAIACGMKLVKRDAPRANIIQKDVEMVAYSIIDRNGYKIQGRLAKHFKKTLNIG